MAVVAFGLTAWCVTAPASARAQGAAQKNPAASAPLPGSEACATCHPPGVPAAHHEPDEPPNYHAAALRASPHAGIECAACHADLAQEDFPHSKPKPVDCGQCHGTEQLQYRESIHGLAAQRGEKLAPNWRCASLAQGAEEPEARGHSSIRLRA